MTLKKRYLRLTHLLFLLLILIQFLPDKSTKEVFTSSLIIFAVGVEVIVLAASKFIKKEESKALCYLILSRQFFCSRREGLNSFDLQNAWPTGTSASCSCQALSTPDALFPLLADSHVGTKIWALVQVAKIAACRPSSPKARLSAR